MRSVDYYVGRSLDRLIGVFSPKAACKRMLYRESYASATTPRTSESGWKRVGSNPNTIIGNSATATTARIDKLVRDFPYLGQVQRVITDYSIGNGLGFQSRIIDETTRKADSEILSQRQQIEDAINWWAEDCDISGRLEWWEMQRVGRHRKTASGETCFIKHYDQSGSGFLPFKLQAIDTSHLTDWQIRDVANGNEIYRGIEYDPRTGRTVAYHFDSESIDPTGLTSVRRHGRGSVRVPAELVLFTFDAKHPGLLRGISDLASAVMVAHDFEDFFQSEVDAAKMSSKWIGTMQTDDIAEFYRRFNVAKNSNTSQYEQTLYNAAFQFLKPGEDMKFTQPTRPANILGPFTQLVLRMIAASSGFPYELIAQDFRELNYTVSRASRAHHEKSLKPIIHANVRKMCHPVMTDVITSAVLHGKLRLKNYFLNPRHYQRATYQIPGLEPVDPFRQAKADAENLANMLTSPQEIISARGGEAETVIEQYETFLGIIKEHGFDPNMFMAYLSQKSSTNTQSNGQPASGRSVEEDDYELRLIDTM